MRKEFINYIFPIFVFSFIWGGIEFILPIKYSDAHISVELCSILYAVGSITSLILDLPAGKLSDLIGREKLLSYSMLIALLAFIILILYSNFNYFLISTILIGIAYGLNWSPLMAFISDKSNPDNQGRTFGGFLSLDGLGEAVAPIIIAIFIINVNNEMSLLFLTFASLICALIFFKQSRISNKISKKTNTLDNFLSFKSSLTLFKKSPFKNIFLFSIGFFVAFFWQSIWFTQPLIGFYENTIIDSALIIAAFSIPSIVFSPLLGKLIDSYKVERVFFISIVMCIFFLQFFYYSTATIYKVISIFIASIGILGIKLVMNVMVVKMYNKKNRGEFFGILETVRDLSFTITPIFIAIFYKYIGLDGIYIVNSLVAILILLISIYQFKSERIRNFQ